MREPHAGVVDESWSWIGHQRRARPTSVADLCNQMHICICTHADGHAGFLCSYNVDVAVCVRCVRSHDSSVVVT